MTCCGSVSTLQSHLGCVCLHVHRCLCLSKPTEHKLALSPYMRCVCESTHLFCQRTASMSRLHAFLVSLRLCMFVRSQTQLASTILHVLQHQRWCSSNHVENFLLEEKEQVKSSHFSQLRTLCSPCPYPRPCLLAAQFTRSSNANISSRLQIINLHTISNPCTVTLTKTIISSLTSLSPTPPRPSAESRGDTTVPGQAAIHWSRLQYEEQFSRFSNNIGHRSFEDRLCQPLPIDIV